MNCSQYGCAITVLVALLLSSCKYDQFEEAVDCSMQGPELVLVNQTDTQCGVSDGSVELEASGGGGDYTFWSSMHPDQEQGTFMNLSAGSYIFMVRDGNTCIDSISVTVANLNGVLIQSVDVVDAGCGTLDGRITVSAVGGLMPYSYHLNDVEQSSSVFENLVSGIYSVKVVDENGCEFVQDVQVPSGVRYTASIAPIISNNCALANCHGGTQNPDFRDFQNVQHNANRIKTRTGNGSMPPNATLSQNEIDQIACWVDDGAPDN